MKKRMFRSCLLLACVLSAACGDDAKEEIPLPVYEAVSVEYEDLTVERVWEQLPVREFVNTSGSAMDIKDESVSRNGFVSCFSEDGFPEGDYSGCRLSVPSIDSDGNPEPAFSALALLMPGEEYAFDYNVSTIRRMTSLPSGACCRIVVTNRNYRLTASFVCTLRNRLSGERLQVRGRWSALWYCGQNAEITISDDDA